jgi:hypothetical protein
VFAQHREAICCSKSATWSTSAFSPGVPATLLKDWHTGSLTPHKTPHKVFVVQIIAFFPLVEELVLLLCEEGAGTLRLAWWRVLGLYAPWGSRPPGTSRIAELCWL